MNKQRRNELQKAINFLNHIKNDFENTIAIIESAASEEQECFDNLTEGLQATERGQRMQEVAQTLQNIADSMSNFDFYEYLADIEEASI